MLPVASYARHQEHMQAVGTHYGPTRIIGPTGHAIGGTAQHSGDHLKLPTSPCRATISDYYGPGGAAGGWTSPPPASRDSQESAVGRMELLADVGWSDPAASGLNDHATLRERADASVLCTGLGTASGRSTVTGRVYG